MKGRLSWLDVRATVNECSKIVGAHVKNVYSTSKKSVLIKFHNKTQLYIDPPSRFQVTHAEHALGPLMPIAIYLRRVLSNARVEAVTQVGFDRIACIHLGTARGKFKLVVEIYAGGNLILLDESQTVLNLLRPVPDLGIVKDSPYIINAPDLELTLDRFDALKEESPKKKLSTFLSITGAIVDDIARRMAGELGMGDAGLGGLEEARRAVGEAAFRRKFEEFFGEIKKELCSVGDYGFVQYEGGRPVSFGPWRMLELPQKYREFSSFGAAMDAAFEAAQETETKAEKKARRIREAQEKSLQDKLRSAEQFKSRAEKILENADTIITALEIIKSSFSSGTSEREFNRFRVEAAEQGNVYAQAIKKVGFGERRAQLLIDGTPIEMDFTRTVHEEATELYSKAKKMEERARKAGEALEQTKRRSKPQKKAAYEKVERKAYWFEKFHWFITKDKDVVVAGRDMRQNEVLVKKHLRDGDFYFHADVAGAASVIARQGCSEDTKSAAAAMAMCLSKAWERNVVCAVYCVSGHQVNKSAPTGEFLKTGSFMIQGKKEFYYPPRLEYGFGIVYKVKRGLAEEMGALGLDEAEPADKPFLSSFMADPGDSEVQAALPMCGPYSSMESPKYRLLPGSSKKGLMAKELLALAMDDAGPRKRFVASITDREMQLTLPSHTKLAQAEIKRRGSQSAFAARSKGKAKRKAKK